MLAVAETMAQGPMAPEPIFTTDWFSPHLAHWSNLFDQVKPRDVLEVGCYEGRASTFFIERLASTGGNITCVDTWEGGNDLPPEMMAGVEDRFHHNIACATARSGFGNWPGRALRKIKERSSIALAQLLGAGEKFDLIYVDGSHTAPDVLTDAVLGFELLRVGGAMVFDDYPWQAPQGQQDALNMPKPAIDAFVNLNLRRLASAPFGDGNWQLLVLKAFA